MPKRSKFAAGIIDPITLIGVLFLIITLSVGTYVVADKKYDFNIFEKARIIECFPAGTKISLNNGEIKNIEKFAVGDQVLSEGSGGEKKVSTTQKLWKLWSFNMCSVDFESGEQLKLTNPHPLYTQDGWKAINVKSALEHNPELIITELKESDSVKKLDGAWDKITSITCEYGLFRVYNLAVDNNNNYFAEGFLAHNKGGGAGIITDPNQIVYYDEVKEKIIKPGRDDESENNDDGGGNSDPDPAPAPVQIQPTSSCTNLCLKNATPDECGCGGIIPAGVILPPSGQTGSNASTYNDGNPTNDYVGIVTNNNNPVTPVINAPPPVVQTKTCRGKSQDYAVGVVVVGGVTSEDGIKNGYGKCTENGWSADCDPDPNNIKLCTITDLTPDIVPVYLQPQYQAAMQAQQNIYPIEPYVAGPAITQTTPTVTTPQKTVYTKSNCDSKCSGSQSCVALDYGYYGCQQKTTLQPKTLCLETEGNAWVNNSCVSNTSSTNAFTDMVGGSGATVNLPPDPQTLLSNMLPSLDQALGKLPGLEGINTSEIQNFNYPVQNSNKPTFFDKLGSLFSTSNQPVLPEDFNPQMSALSVAGGQSVQLPTSVCSNMEGQDYQNCINDVWQGTKNANNLAIATAGIVYGGPLAYSYAPEVMSTVMNIKYVPQILTALDLVDTAVTGAGCLATGNQETCSYFQASAFIPGFSTPNMIADTLDDFSSAWSGIGNKALDNIVEIVLPTSSLNFSNNLDSIIPSSNQANNLVEAMTPSTLIFNLEPAGRTTRIYEQTFGLTNPTLIDVRTGQPVEITADQALRDYWFNGSFDGRIPTFADPYAGTGARAIEEGAMGFNSEYLATLEPLSLNPVIKTFHDFTDAIFINSMFGTPQTVSPNNRFTDFFYGNPLPNTLDTANIPPTFLERVQNGFVNFAETMLFKPKPNPLIPANSIPESIVPQTGGGQFKFDLSNDSLSPSAGVLDGVKNWLGGVDIIKIIDDAPIPRYIKRVLKGTELVGNNDGFGGNSPADDLLYVNSEGPKVTIGKLLESQQPAKSELTDDHTEQLKATYNLLTKSDVIKKIDEGKPALLFYEMNALVNRTESFPNIRQTGPSGALSEIVSNQGQILKPLTLSLLAEKSSNLLYIAVNTNGLKLKIYDPRIVGLTIVDPANYQELIGQGYDGVFLPSAFTGVATNGYDAIPDILVFDGKSLVSKLNKIDSDLGKTLDPNIPTPLSPSAGFLDGVRDWWYEKGPLSWLGGSPAKDPGLPDGVNLPNNPMSKAMTSEEQLLKQLEAKYLLISNESNKYVLLKDILDDNITLEDIIKLRQKYYSKIWTDKGPDGAIIKIVDIKTQSFDEWTSKNDASEKFQRLIKRYKEILPTGSINTKGYVSLSELLELDNELTLLDIKMLRQINPEKVWIDSMSDGWTIIKVINTSGPKISNQGSFFAPFGIMATLPIVGIYYVDQYFDLRLFDNIKDALSDNSVAKSLGVAVNSGNFPILKPLAPILPLPNTGFENIDYEPVIDQPANTTELEIKSEDLTSYGQGECTRSGNNDYCDGTRMYELYLWYKNQPDGWWQDGDFTPADFLAMMLVAESSSGDPELLKSIMVATANQLWGQSDKHKPYCTTPNCEAGIFNFLGDYVQSAGERYNGLISNEGNPSQGTLRNLASGEEVAKYFAKNGLSIDQIANDVIYNPISSEYNNDSPTQWGVTGCGENCQGIEIDWLKNLNNTNGVKYNTTDKCGIYDVYGIGDVQAVVYTNNQMYNWSLNKKDSNCY